MADSETKQKPKLNRAQKQTFTLAQLVYEEKDIIKEKSGAGVTANGKEKHGETFAWE